MNFATFLPFFVLVRENPSSREWKVEFSGESVGSPVEDGSFL